MEAKQCSTDDERYHAAKAMMMEYTSQFPDIDVISSEEIIEIMKCGENTWLVDVRNVEEQDVSMLPGALSKYEFEAAIKKGDVAPTDLIISYCTIGYRSGVYSMELYTRGFQNVKNGEGILLWTYTNVPLVVKNTDGKVVPAHSIHTFGDKWDIASTRYRSHQYGQWEIALRGILSYFRL